VQGNLNDGLAAIADEEPFDLYFCAYGSMSHLETASLVSLMEDVAAHATDRSLVVMDLLGRYSLEWPDNWQAQSDGDTYRDYTMSYLYRDVNNQIMTGVDVEHFPMRYWTGAEIDKLIAGVNRTVQHSNGAERTLHIRQKFDRSIFVGRHIDTGEYNAKLKPMRRVINSLHEDYIRTDLNLLFWEPQCIPEHPDEAVNEFFEELMTSWNRVVDFAQTRLQGTVSLANISDWEQFSAPLQFTLMTLDRVITSVEWMWYGDPRANIIEPQLGYALRNLEHKLQQGLGCGHGFMVILEMESK